MLIENIMKKINDFCKNRSSINLHLGCGGNYYRDYVNIDYFVDNDIVIDSSREKLKSDLLLDITKLDEYVDDYSVDKILMVHVLEHFTRWNAIKLLKVFYRVLKKYGIVEMEHPDLDGVIKFYLENKRFTKTPIGELNIGFTQFYGNQWDELEYETHKYVWTKQELKIVSEHIGFEILELSNNVRSHVRGRDMRIVLQKQVNDET